MSGFLPYSLRVIKDSSSDREHADLWMGGDLSQSILIWLWFLYLILVVVWMSYLSLKFTNHKNYLIKKILIWNIQLNILRLRIEHLDSPDGSVVKNPPAIAGDMASIPDGRIPQAAERLQPVHHSCWAYALEPGSHNCWNHMPQLLKSEHLEPVLCNKPLQWEAVTPQLDSSLCLPQLEKSPWQQHRPSIAKKKRAFIQ